MDQTITAGMKGCLSRKAFAAFWLALACCLFCEQASASQIQGAVSFQGVGALSGSDSGNTTTISFTNPSWRVLGGTGNYSFSGTSAAFISFSFTGSGTRATLLQSGIPEGTFTFGTSTYSFELTALTNAIVTNGTLLVSGTGIAHITGFDDTPGSFVLAGSSQGCGFQLSTGDDVGDPPIPTTPDAGSDMYLLAIALAGLEALRRKLRSS